MFPPNPVRVLNIFEIRHPKGGERLSDDFGHTREVVGGLKMPIFYRRFIWITANKIHYHFLIYFGS